MLKTVDQYISSHPEWAQEKLIALRKIALKAGFEESVKWNAPSYAAKKNVLGLAAFKGWVSLWFHNGSFIEDAEKQFQPALESTKTIRQWRFLPDDKINEALVLKYMLEAKKIDLQVNPISQLLNQ